MLLEELTPLLSKRLSESNAYKNWQGTIGIKGSEHRASLIIRDDEIRISAEVSEGTAIHLSTDDETLTRFILGVFHTLRSISAKSVARCAISQPFGSRSVGNPFPGTPAS